MTTMILTLICLSSLLLLIYPFVIYPAVLRRLPSRVGPRARGESPGSAALLIAARNEAACLPRLVEDLRRLKRLWPDLDIRIYDDASSDGTRAILDSARDILTIRRGARPSGKARGLQELLEGCRAELLIFMDANSRIRPGQIGNFRDHFADPGIGAVGARLVLEGDRSTLAGRIYWRIEERIKAEETRSGSTMGCDGALWAIRRAIYPRFDPAASDDFRPSMEPLFHGLRVVSAHDIEVRESVAATMLHPDRIRRIACGAWHAHRAMRGQLRRLPLQLQFKYVSHKLLRWFAGLWLALAAGSGIALVALSSAGPMAATLGAIGLAAAASGVLPLGAAGRIARSFLATTSGVLAAMRGQRISVWSPVR